MYRAQVPLIFPGPPSGVDPYTIQIRHFGRDPETDDYVECRVTARAMLDRWNARGQTSEELLRAFNANCSEIEDAARRKYAAGDVVREPDRVNVHLDTQDF